MTNNYNELINIFASITNKDEMKKFLEEILTDKERISITLRWQLMKDINSGKSQREIASEHHLSLCKITRGSKILKSPNSICKKYLNQ
ncbi:MAG: Trp family transcriptional regulator [Candidatus Margulisbacteria bacterium]|nr:Trp family transcriptional regulator [Candidatus Margulisiibacteriota bacterium]